MGRPGNCQKALARACNQSRVTEQVPTTRNYFLPLCGTIISLPAPLISEGRTLLNMDPDIKKLAILLMFQLSMFSTLECIARDETAVFMWHWQQFYCMTLALHKCKLCSGRGPRRLWAHDRGLHKPGFFDQNLLGSFNSREFKGRMRMDVSTLKYLCSILAPDLQRRDTNMRLAIPVQVKVVVLISRLATSNSMQCIADLYRIGLSSSQIAVSEFCGALKIIC